MREVNPHTNWKFSFVSKSIGVGVKFRPAIYVTLFRKLRLHLTSFIVAFLWKMA